ncbi:MAG: response regulator [Chthoniobacteraceae bacterium]
MSLIGSRILVVDDDVVILRLVREAVMGLTQCEVETTPNPLYGFELVLRKPYDLLIFDYSMPGIDGAVLYQLLGKVFAVNPPEGRKLPPVLLMSGNASQKKAQEFLREPGVRGLLAKPFSLEKLTSKIAESLRMG